MNGIVRETGNARYRVLRDYYRDVPIPSCSHREAVIMKAGGTTKRPFVLQWIGGVFYFPHTEV